jgi:hypothetical protein
MNATFQVQEISKHHNGDVAVTLRQVYDSQNRQLSDSTNPSGGITVTITDRTDFFQQGQKYLVNFRNTAPASPASVTLASGKDVDPVERSTWFRTHPDATFADFVAYKNAQPAASAAAAKHPAGSSEEAKLRAYLLANHKSETRNESPASCAIRLLSKSKKGAVMPTFGGGTEQAKLGKFLLANYKSETGNETPEACAIRLLAKHNKK